MHVLAKKIQKRTTLLKSLLCVGLDPDTARLPERFRNQKHPQFEFNKWIIDQTHEYAVAFKPNSAFYEARGAHGYDELSMTAEYLHTQLPDVFTILDAKRADIDSTNNGYVESIFDQMKFDAVTLHPYLGKEALKPFLSRKDKVSIILCRTSNPGAPEFQDLDIAGKPLWQIVAERVSRDWNLNENCMLVVGATYPEEMKKVREIVGDMTFLVPGIGAQGGDLGQVMKNGLNSKKQGMIISSSRGIIFSEDPRAEAKKLKDEMSHFL